MSLSEIYREVIMDHYGRPRNRGRLAQPDIAWELENPVCGDRIRIEATVADGAVTDIRFSGQGCSISQASASMMTELVKGKNVKDARNLTESFLAMMKGDPGDYRTLGEVQALQGVTRSPVRVKCATLAWHVLDEGLERREAGTGGAARE